MLRNFDEERRSFHRVRVEDLVANSRVVAAESAAKSYFIVWPVRDISLGGVRVRSEEMLKENTRAFLNIDLNAVQRTVRMVARVVWCRERAAQEYDAGICFTRWPDENDRPPLHRFVYHVLAEEEKRLRAQTEP